MSVQEAAHSSTNAALEIQRRHRRAEDQRHAVALVRRFATSVVATWSIVLGLVALQARALVPTVVFVLGIVHGLLLRRVLASTKTDASSVRLRNAFIALGLGYSLLLAGLALATGGLLSIHLPITVIPLVGVAVIPQPLRRFVNAVFILLPGWIVLGVGLVVIPTLSAQLSQRAVLERGSVVLGAQVALAGFFLLVSDAQYRLRRKLHESRSLGRYQLKRRVGVGGMGEVWAAYDTAMKRDVALKILTRATDAVDRARFEREVRATSELSHPHTVRIYDYAVTDDGLRYYAMELLEGGTLEELVAGGGALTPARAVRIGAQVARALAEAHARGIIHRDIKPANIFVTSAGGESDYAKVIDFGIARVEDDSDALTTTGMAPGTPAFMSPEAMFGRALTPAADLYSLGATLYYALTGVHPHREGTVAATIASRLADAASPPSERSPHPLSPELDAIVLRCLAKDPSKRFESAGDLARALVRVPEASQGSFAVSLDETSKTASD